MSEWYALSVWNAEKAEEALRGVCAVYVPCETVERRRGRKPPMKLRRPIIPGYLFAYCPETAFEAIQAEPQVHDFVRFTRPDGVRIPLRMAPNALAPLFLAEAFGALDYTRTPPPYEAKRGDRVKVRSGKWKGYFARVLSVSKRKALIETQWCKLEVERDHLEAAA